MVGFTRLLACSASFRSRCRYRQTSKRPLVSSKALQDSIKGEHLLRRAKNLCEIAKLGEEEPLWDPTCIYSTLGKLGDYYNISYQAFPAVTGRVSEFRLEPVHGNLVLVSNQGCDASDYPAVLKGNIPLEGEVHGTLGTPSDNHIATLGIPDAEAAPVIKKLEKGETVEAIAYVDAEVKTTVTDNIIAQTTEGDPNNCVMLGGHSDSVTAGPGINDDGSGSMTLLEIAMQLTKFSVNNCVRFAWWAAEEEGLLGSDYYASTLPEEENQKIRLFMDYDMLGSPNFAYQIYNATDAVNPTGSQALRDLYVDWYESQGLNYSFIPFDGRSDYDGFIRAGIPAGGIATGAEGVKTKEEAEMYGLCDDVGNVNMTAWELNSKLVAHSVATYAVSFKGFPERTAVAATKAYEQKTKYHGSKLFI
ncbi:aminopeptidase Y [Apiospora phragmitis]|uniref:Peptide hydrolase n=1 Tax=Apiospora phragmitis TaxID=2905665 RepID=A0ABR1VZI9_9PEZI